MKILVGMSGGIDSTVTAELLRREGHKVIGVTMSVRPPSRIASSRVEGCYGFSASSIWEEAREIANALGIEHHSILMNDEFEKIVINYYKKSYANGETPVPCVYCNRFIKFDALLREARRIGIEYDYFATGHYVKIKFDENQNPILHRARDHLKDQSYFLHRINSDVLKHVLFPLGDYLKEEVRSIAKELNIPVQNRKESTGFYAGDYRELLNFSEQPGAILNQAGEIIGRHNGIWNYTIGQRKGLNSPPGVSRFVTALDAKNNLVFTGGKKDLHSLEFMIDDLHWSSGHPPSAFEAEVKVGNTHPLISCAVDIDPDQDSVALSEKLYRVQLRESVIAVASGQFAVFYQNDRLLGGGVIRKIV